MKKILERLPILPLSALVFYLTVLSLWKLGILPSPEGIVVMLEGLYQRYGLTGLFIVSFLEGIVYLGLYFPGSVIVALSVILSDGKWTSLLSISMVVALALTLTSIINYYLGRKLTREESDEIAGFNRKRGVKGLIASALHPNLLAFYFFHSGIKKRNPRRILLVFPIITVYGFLLALLIYSAKEGFKRAIENPLFMIGLISLWIFASFMINLFHKRQV